MEEMIKLTNGKKTIIRSKIQYEANVAHFKMRGYVPLDDVKKEIKKATVKDISDNVVKLKTKRKKMLRKLKKRIRRFIAWIMGIR